MVDIVPYHHKYLEEVCQLIKKDLSEPYSKYVYRYFVHQWPEYNFVALLDGQMVGAVISKQDIHRGQSLRGYIAMLAVKDSHRGKGIATLLTKASLNVMIEKGAQEIVLETEVDNDAAMSFYERLGFCRYKRLYRYYLNGTDAFRYILYP
ncbi:NatC N-acetyltransferase complex catalytic subunit Naa30 [Schizosaccharomyces osmophilus]|uniref:NatC N-acetyltransferase complex catalytic subunit Naa30 n=1 Tax=Schizosaccharomyces osmophilus TaxID=2545709 RepID=A0AAF0AV73_9SCHI|nr:NatC N-acetyltransferase complex catalytic subunit Naa30 [Schizosaccharomyces osmophilus]WBW71644.1 NatC N-acetyltransferase complex catalytic subunit Naa30 [Schizosaccharomyces osmophilus]